jgi:hypothetical protein
MKLINVGTLANDGTGDDLRDAFIKVNDNFAELNSRVPESTTATNIGAGAGLFSGAVGAELEFKSIVAGSNISIETSLDTVTVSTGPGLQALTVNADTGAINFISNSQLSIRGGTNTTTVVSNGELIVNSVTDLSSDTAPALSNDLDAQGHSIDNVSTVYAGNVIGLVHGIDIRDLNKYTTGFDLGSIPQPISSLIDILIATMPADFGTVSTPSMLQLDLGQF